MLKVFVVPLSNGSDASKTTASLQAQSEPHTAIRHTVPAIDRANAELQPVHIAFQLDLNLDPRSTNHAHADFWLSELGEGQRAVGPKYSVNVLGGQNVWLYKPGAPGRDLGTLDRCGPDAIQTLLQDAAEEFGGMAR